jgi:hypothetical protein
MLSSGHSFCTLQIERCTYEHGIFPAHCFHGHSRHSRGHLGSRRFKRNSSTDPALHIRICPAGRPGRLAVYAVLHHAPRARHAPAARAPVGGIAFCRPRRVGRGAGDRHPAGVPTFKPARAVWEHPALHRGGALQLLWRVAFRDAPGRHHEPLRQPERTRRRRLSFLLDESQPYDPA